MAAPDPPSWFRQRRYLHFDRPIGPKKAELLLRDPAQIARHAFFPLISYSVTSKKVRKSADRKKLEIKPKARPISYASHVDAHIYSYYSVELSKAYEDRLKSLGLSDCVLAFRPLGKSNIEFALAAFAEIKKLGSCAAVALDVSGFFDNLDHSHLKSEWSALLGASFLPPDHYNIFKSITKFATVNRSELFKELEISKSNPRNGRTRICEPWEFRVRVRAAGLIKRNPNKFGIPQGTPISSILSNIYMLSFDSEMHAYATSVGGIYFRYCDDILLIVPIKERDRAAGYAQEKIQKLKLRINPEKTVLSTFIEHEGQFKADRPLQYLGFLYDGDQVLIRSAALSRYSERMRRGVRLAKATQRKRNNLKSLQGAAQKKLFRKKLYKIYSYLGGRNFISYGHRAARIMNSTAIRGQLKPLWNRLLKEIEKE